jgi:hypothetical protein
MKKAIKHAVVIIAVKLSAFASTLHPGNNFKGHYNYKPPLTDSIKVN